MRRCLLLLALYTIVVTAKAQFIDSLQVQVGTVATAASEEYQPLWLVSKRFATIADRKNDLSTNVRITNKHDLFIHADSVKKFYLQYGLDAYVNNHFKETFFKEAFVKAGFKNWQFRAGRFAEITGDLDPDLSSGSLGISGNALPIPKVGFIVTDYTDVPFTNGWLQFKGQISHGWFGNNRYMKDAYYHEKLFYMRLGKKKLKLYGGVQHFGEWGGRRGGVQLERSWKGFFDVLLVKEADDGSVGTDVNGRPPNRPGDQRGLFEAGIVWENEKLLLRGYNQTPFETGRDVDLRNVDRLVGFTYVSKNTKSALQKIVGELLHTKDMLSFVEQRDRQSFYNNGYYKTGWEYNDRIIGTPLFINRNRASYYFPTVRPYDWNAPTNSIHGNDNIINNRVVAGHLGLLYQFAGVHAKTMVTFTRNYGTHAPRWFAPHKDQWYILQQFSYNIRNFNLMAGAGIDKGDLSNNIGFMVGVSKALIGNF